MSGFVVARDRPDRRAIRRVSGWTRDYPRRAALADFGCGILGVFAAAELRFGNDVTGTYIALSLALSAVWLAAIWLAGGYDVRFIGTGSDEFRKILNAGVGLTAAIAVFSYAINFELSRAYVLIALPTTTALDLVARFAVRKRLHHLRASGRYMLSVVAVGHETEVADLVKELGRDRYHGLTVDRGRGGLSPPARPGHGFSRYPPTQPLVPRVRHSTTACLKAHNCALPGTRSRDCDQGIRPASRIRGGWAKDAAAER